MIAVSEKPKIKVEINLEPNEKSEVLTRIKDFILNLSSSYERGAVVLNEHDPDTDFIPDEDQETPDLDVDDTEGPSITEDDSPTDEFKGIEYVRLGDLL
ncbi:MAG: hypothetical protein RIA62_17420 [Cyclobacteriaceae bacterium]|tara:strand:- start:5568 stop:5864 length:297 start_codon:yes stop_codon:yes gene_type:complete